MTDALIYVPQARKLGADAAKAAASWINANDPRYVLELLEAGDPLADEFLPATPELSGEWADDPTPLSLAREIVGEAFEDLSDETAGALQSTLADAWEAGVSETFESACEAELRKAAGIYSGAFALQLEFGDSAMRTLADVAGALQAVAAELEQDSESGIIRDANGNTVGRYAAGNAPRELYLDILRDVVAN